MTVDAWFAAIADELLPLPQEDYDDIVNGWRAKLKRSSSGEQRWGLFVAKKP